MLPRLLIAGADISNRNLGCAALGWSALQAIREVGWTGQVGLLDSAHGSATIELPGFDRCEQARIGFRQSRSPFGGDWRPLNAASIGLRIPLTKPMRAIAGSSALLDVSGGDSFADLYGRRRFEWVNAAKRAALAFGVPLILLPQTYGPFRDPAIRSAAERIVREARGAFARDARSFDVLRSLLGADFAAERHRCGVDMAFLLPEPASVPSGIADAAGRAQGIAAGAPLVGLNVSGLIANDPVAARERYGFRVDYLACLVRIMESLFERGAGAVLLVPHVLGAPGAVDDDVSASVRFLERLPRGVRERVVLPPAAYGPREAKWMIARCGFFIGTRMHATIAALSSGVACATINYSDKAIGVFDSCGMADSVVDPRALADDEVVRRVVGCFDRRTASALELRGRLDAVREAARSQMRDIIGMVAAAPRRGR